MRLNLTKKTITKNCDNVILFSLYAIAFFLPISKAIIEVFIYFAIFCFLLKKILLRETLSKSKLNYAVLLYLAVCLISIFFSCNHQISFRSFLGKVLQNVTVFIIALESLNTKQKIKNFLKILFASSLLLGIDGIYQYFTTKEFIRHRPYGGFSRITATFPSANDYGCYLVVVISFVLASFFNKPGFKRIFRLFLLALSALLFICLFLTVSRGAWFGFLASVLFISIWIKTLSVAFLVIGILIITTKQFYEPFLKERLNNFFIFEDSSSIDRRQIWGTAWRMFMRKPWLGLGIGTFMFNFKYFMPENYPFTAPYAHNCFLQIAAETGIVGLISFLSILVLFFTSGIENLIYRNKSFPWYVLLGSLAAILSFCVQMTVDTVFYSLDLGVLFWLILGLGASAIKLIEQEEKALA